MLCSLVLNDHFHIPWSKNFPSSKFSCLHPSLAPFIQWLWHFPIPSSFTYNSLSLEPGHLSWIVSMIFLPISMPLAPSSPSPKNSTIQQLTGLNPNYLAGHIKPFAQWSPPTIPLLSLSPLSCSGHTLLSAPPVWEAHPLPSLSLGKS